jgi:hypothetical protein
MDQLYTTVDAAGTKIQCFAVNNHVSAWLMTDMHGSVSLTLGYHPNRFGTNMDLAKANGLTWASDLEEFLSISSSPLEELASSAISSFKSSQKIDFGRQKTIEVLFNPMYARKVQISNGNHFIRMPYPIFTRMLKKLREVMGLY